MQFCVLFYILGVAGYVSADCYPGDTIYNSILQEIYHGVTSDNIKLTSRDSIPINRRDLCDILTTHHNSDKNAVQSQTNKEFLGFVSVSLTDCRNALTYTQGYNTVSGWQKWAGYHSGTWYAYTQQFSDGAQWSPPYYKTGVPYAVQPVRFDSQDRIAHCNTRDQTGATCRYGWNQSGLGVLYVWGWDPKEDGCTPGGRQGAHVGFTFSVGGASCIVWVTTEEAFLECVKNGRRTSTTSRTGSSRGFGQWTMRKYQGVQSVGQVPSVSQDPQNKLSSNTFLSAK